ncbi:serpin family protein [Paenibacillus xylaniclasticus]|uniref:serpin family protein n=1 Tax=Paenibacillus xylaniclasticus TaxID=588083 RepID=UPI000FDA8434|nr:MULTISPECIES: serpin family protein [Paenibacillus]GFN30494.1 serine/threonine protein kinase [Paenibacillus curdlanolyticus]
MLIKIISAAAAAAITVITVCSYSISIDEPKPITAEQRTELIEGIDPAIVQASNQFGMRLHEQLVKKKPGHNVFLSPISISTAFAMAASGSAGNTQKEMLDVLGWDGKTVDQINTGYRKLTELLTQSGSGVKLHTANSVWADKRTTLLASFTDSLQKYYSADPKQVDFSDSEGTADQINSWVSKHTNSMIKKLIQADSIQTDTRLMLINAIYFDGKWKDPFNRKKTADAPFYLSDGSSVTVPFMQQSGNYEYKRTDLYEAIRIPYGEGQMAMTIILPTNDQQLNDILPLLWNGELTVSERWTQLNGSIHLPKFKLDDSTKLNEALQSLGMKLPFDEMMADLSGMTGNRNLVISDVRHKSVIEVDEEGTKAAAVTSIEAATTSLPPDEPFNMNINRPFYFIIEDLQSGVHLFVGSLYNPI